MGCASSAALPFLTTKENQAVVESPILNGKSSTELHKSNTGLNDTEVENLKDINESFISEKMKDVVDSTAVQGVIGGVIQTKENVYNEVKEVGDAISEKLTSVVSGVEDTIDSAFGKISTTVDQAGDKVKSEIKALEEDVKSLFDAGEKEKPKDSTIKTEDIDELLNALPTAEETIDAAKTSENVVERIVEEVHQETN